eukprot:403370970
MLPLIKVLLVTFKILSRPLNNVLKRVFMHNFVFMHRFIGVCGQKAHQYELYLNRRIVSDNDKLDFYIKPLSDEAAFNKGVEYFVELVFFYGILFTIAIYEVKKAHDISENVKFQVKTYDQQNKEVIQVSAKIQKEIDDCKGYVEKRQQEYQEMKKEIELMNIKLRRHYIDKEI